jgi:outer membrane protein OmpA-like peptidoglycan-associated protein
LAVARGQAVTALLIARGVPPHRLSAVGIHPSSSYEFGPIGRLVTFFVPNPGRQPGAVPDRDGDQIPDPWDNCPEEREVFNGFWDDDGCPDRAGDALRTFQLEEILFGKNSAALTPDAIAWLEGIANTLLARPNVGWLDIEGEFAADEPEGQRLARARAEAVRAFLISRNVKPARLFAEVGDRYWGCKTRTKACLDENRMVWFSHALAPLSARR